ncbi:MAG: glutamate--tRNA ligase family protein, partial [Patescibacteria group bacterium]
RQGEAVLRLKTDLKHKDPSVRDWWIARIVDKPVHPRVTGKHVWPSYQFASAIDDHLLKVTLIIRGQEHAQSETKQKYLYDIFKWKYPHAFHYGRITFSGMVMSKSAIQAGIMEGKYTGWDDPRLGTLQALRRRGFQVEGIQNLMIELGLKTSDTSLNPEVLATFNGKALAKKGNYGVYAFIEEPVHLSVGFCPAVEAEQAGRTRELIQGNQNFYVSKKDVKELKKDESKFEKAGITKRIIELLKKGKEEAIFSKILATIRLDSLRKFDLPEKELIDDIDL